jgi:hypothetical protein
MSQPRLYVTADTDWVSEACIARFCDDMIAVGVKPLLFATHDSAVTKQLLADDLIEVGIHPNFFPGSDQGESYEEVLDFLIGLYPKARISRSHSYFENSRVTSLLFSKGFRFDSNIALIEKAGIEPLDHWSGLRRFPVFWEDDIHWTLKRSWVFEDSRHLFLSPGLKVVDVHPVNYAFNVSSREQYQQIKPLTRTASDADIAANRFPDPGVADFLSAAVEAMRRADGKVGTMSDLMDNCGGPHAHQ